jgi:SOS response regulatory protein OraA/RecX
MAKMDLIEILKAKGISDEIIKAVQEDMKTNKIFTASEENLDIRYGKLKTEHDSKLSELTEANNLIAELKKNNKGVEKLQAELQQTKIESAIKVELLSNKALDVDYLTFKLKEKGELELDENGKIKGWDDKIAALKTQFPTQFESTGGKKYEEHKLPDDQGSGDTITKEALLKKPYAERMKLYSENPDAYKNAMSN